eukprot:129440_1
MSTALSLVDSLLAKIDSIGEEQKMDISAKIKVTYFPGRGLCEPIRLLLAGIGIEFENIFVQSKEQFDKLKQEKELAYNQLPLVEMDGLNLVQSGSAFRYIANKYNFMGSNATESYLIDLTYEGCQDARSNGKILYFPWTKDKDAILQNFKFKRYFGRWEKIIGQNDNADGYFIRSGPSAADIAVFEVLEFMELIIGKDALSKSLAPYTKLTKNYAVTRKLGNVEAYIKNKRNHLGWQEYAQCVDATLNRT